MIKLDVEDYCHDCESFEPDAELPSIMHGSDGSRHVIGDTIVFCRNWRKCRDLMKHLKKNEVRPNG